MSHDWAKGVLRQVDPTGPVRLTDAAARVPGVPDKGVLLSATAQLQERLAELQEALHADGRHALLLVLQGRDASGKDGTIKKVMGALNPIGVRVAAFGPPTPLELRHDFLWRVHQQVPPRGTIGVFNRSHYEDVLAVRVRALAPEAVWRGRYAQINAFEQMLAENGVVTVKVLLHVSRGEQLARLRERMEDPHKNWKFRMEDIADRERWDDYTAAYEDALRKCSTSWAPWHVVPADDKAVRNYLVARLLVDALEALAPQYPALDPAIRSAAAAWYRDAH
ncbi:MAG: polyphosphate kinase 2 family protein [Gemmatimonadetes bacterium]|nr:polyphosphate kinase 2 family protein [Gemmatimonadota bacterium]